MSYHMALAGIAGSVLLVAGLELVSVLPAKTMAALVFAVMLLVCAVAIYGGIVDRRNRIDAERRRKRPTAQ